MNAKQILDREYLEIRAKILELAASFDRMDRAEGSVTGDERMHLIAKGISIISSSESDRAKQIQMLFSREYDPNWQSEFQASMT